MRFKLDENLPVEAAALLREAGHDAITVLEQEMSGKSDPDLVDVCRQERRTLVTLDVDFADIRIYPPEEYAGLLVLRLRRQDKAHVLAILQRLLPQLNQESVDGQLWIVEEERIRVRV